MFKSFWFIVFVCIAIMSCECEASKTAAKFVRASLVKQLDLAKELQSSLGRAVYLFDGSGKFVGAESKLSGSIRYLENAEGMIGLLSVAAQESFRAANTYMQFSDPAGGATISGADVILPCGITTERLCSIMSRN